MFVAAAQVGTHAVALKMVNGIVTTEHVTLKRDVMYFEEDVMIDPLGRMGVNADGSSIGTLSDRTVGGAYQSRGYYGFKLPKNRKGYQGIFIHTSNLEIA